MAEVPDETSKRRTYLGLRNVRKIIPAEQDNRGRSYRVSKSSMK